MNPTLYGMNLYECKTYLTTERVRTHRKKRIDKKFKKQFGFKTVYKPVVPEGQVLKIDNNIYASAATIAQLKAQMQLIQKPRNFLFGESK